MIRHTLLRSLYAIPYFRGRDRLTCWITNTFSAQPCRLVDGLLMYLDASEWIQLEIIIKGATEPATIRLISELVVEGDVVIDVGAHVGHHAMIAARRAGNAGHVLAIDPQPYNVDRLAHNAALNGFSNIEAICAAAGPGDGFVQFHLQKPSDRARLSLADPSPNDLDILIEVPMRRLDTILRSKNIAKVKLVKIDVEGYELDVLDGLGERLADCKNIIFEVLESAFTEKTEKIANHLIRAGFSLKNVEGKEWKIGAPLPESNVWASRQ